MATTTTTVVVAMGSTMVPAARAEELAMVAKARGEGQATGPMATARQVPTKLIGGKPRSV